jgi:hypothetical protein
MGRGVARGRDSREKTLVGKIGKEWLSSFRLCEWITKEGLELVEVDSYTLEDST